MTALLMGLAAALLWGFHDLLVRYVSQEADVMPMIAVEMTVAAVWMGLFAAVFGDWTALPELLPAVGSGLVYCVGLIGLYKAFSLAPVRLVGPILSAYPLVSLAIAVAQGRVVQPAEWLAAAAVVGGVCVVALFGEREVVRPGQTLRAVLWAIVGGSAYAGTFALGQWATRTGDSMTAIAIGRVASMVIMGGVMVAGRYSFAPLRPRATALIAIGTLDAFGLALVFTAGQFPHPEYAAVSSSTFGIITILLAWRILGERVQPPQWLGIGVIFGAIAYLSASGV